MRIYTNVARGSTTGKTQTLSPKPDGSPITQADLAAHQIIVAGLAKLNDPELAALPVLSEESAAIDWSERRNWQRYWLVDPLDGTKEFIKRNGEFTVNIALIDNGKPVLGMVYAPVLDTLYIGVNGFAGVDKAYKVSNDIFEILDVTKQPPLIAGETVRIVVSRSHRGDESLSPFFQQPHVTVPMGSSLKLCAIANGSADIYPRLGPTSEWDIAAGHAVVEAAGGTVKTIEGEALRYNQKESLLNPHFVVTR
ncbi:3'(2'),5'-bisphosphate nucleotidase [Pseudidiomarina salinarum]|nr:3'(2'),5'-bisphosphate nucleotidase [Pseudidiomarina salinarum]